MSFPVFDVNYPASIKRRINWSDPFGPVVDDATVDFRGRIYALKPGSKQDAFRGRVYGSRPGANDLSPRTFLPRAVLWYKPGAIEPDISAGERVSDGLDSYEALTPGVGKRAGTQVLIVEVECVPVAGLYPFTVQLAELGGSVVTELPMSLWHNGDTDTSRGAYLDASGEAPVEFWEALSVTNREIRLDARVLHIERAVLHRDQPHVSMSLREKHA